MLKRNDNHKAVFKLGKDVDWNIILNKKCTCIQF